MLRSDRRLDEGPRRGRDSYLRLAAGVVALLCCLTLLTSWLFDSFDAPSEPVPAGRSMRSETPLPTSPASAAAAAPPPQRPSPPVAARETAAPQEAAAAEIAVVEGTVRDERGVPVADGVVRLFGAAEAEAPIDALGRYRLEAPPGITGFLRAAVPEHVSPPSFETVALASGTTVRDFEVLRVWVVAGRLLTPEGLPVTRARIEIENPPPGEPISDNTGPGEDGAFRHRFSPPMETKSLLPVKLPTSPAGGPLALRVVPEDRIDALVPLDAERLRAEAFIDVGDIVLRRGGALVVIVREPDGAPVAGASLTLQLRAAEDGSPGVSMRRAGSSDAAGRARFDGLEAGSYVLVAREERHVAAILSPLPVGRAEAETLVVMDRGVAVEGVVVDESGDPVEGARVRVDAVVALAGEGAGGLAEIKTARTAADGSFRVEGLPPDYRERFERLAALRQDSGGAPPEEPFVVRADALLAAPHAGVAAGVRPGEPATIVLRPLR